MIFFPELFEDELFYSAQARYHWITGHDNPKTSLLEMFGIPNTCTTLLFPTQLDAFCRHLPVSNTYTSQELIEKHSFLPYFSLFTQDERVRKVKIMMEYGKGTSIYMTLGITASEIRRPQFLKFCPQCVIVDEEECGEAYWHRSHQAYGVKVCYKHSYYLNDSSVEVDQRHKQGMFTLNNYLKLQAVNTSEAEMTFTNNQMEIYIAQQTYQLLNANSTSVRANQIRGFYVTKLQERGLATSSGRIRWLELLPLFNQYYGHEFLSNISSYVSLGDEDTWLHKLLRLPRVACHPLRHLLFLGFINESVSSLTAAINLQKIEVSAHSHKRRKNLNSIELLSRGGDLTHRVNWHKRDMEIAEKVRLTVRDITNVETKLIRITKSEIGRRLRMQSLFIRAYSKLPKTQELMNELIETVEQFQVRRIKWAVRKLINQKKNVQIWEVFRVAGIKQKFEKKYRILVLHEIGQANEF